MLCDSLGEISSIHPTKSNNNEHSSSEMPDGSPSLPSIHQPLDMSPSGYSKSASKGLTMKQMDVELRNLRRENFDLKLRLYTEKQKKGPRRASDHLPIEESDRKDPSEEVHKACLEKDNEIKSLKNELSDLKQNLDFKTGILLKERDALANDLEATTKVCKGLMAHLVEVREYWRNFMLENSSFNGQDQSLLNSLSDWMNISQDFLNSSIQAFTKDSLDVSAHKADSSIPTKKDQIAAQTPGIPKTPGLRGMSSLGLINDLSYFNDPVSTALTSLKHTIGLKTESFLPQLPNVSEKLSSVLKIDVETQTNGLKGLNTCDTECQSDAIAKIEIMAQTEFTTETKNVQTNLIDCSSKETQKSLEGLECGVQTDLKCIKKKTAISPSTQERPKRAIPVSTVTPHKKETSLCERQLNVKINLPETKNLSQKEAAILKPMTESTPKPPLRPSKRSYTIIPNKENISTPLRPQNSLIPAPKSALKSAKVVRNCDVSLSTKVVQFEMESHLKGFDDQGKEETKAIRVSLTYNHHQLLRTHLGRLSSLLTDLNKLNKEYFLLETISKEEFSNSVWPCLKDMRHIVNSSQVISHHFTVIDEGSVLAQFEKMKVKKANIEKAITQQMKKADKILRKAKLNIRGDL